MLNWGPFMLKPRSGVQTLSLSNLHQASCFSPPPPAPSLGRNLTSGLTCTAGPGLPGAPYFFPYNFKSEEHFSKSQGTLIYWT